MSRELTRDWLRHMRAGNFEAAWRISDHILQTTRQRSQQFVHLGREALWNGGSVAGKRVLIRCCRGLGDALQFIRYAPLVRRTASRVIVQAHAALREVLLHVTGVDAVETLYHNVPQESYDIAVEVMELPHLLRAVVADVPYIRLQPRVAGRSRNLRVGIVWRAGEWDRRRSVPVELIRTLADRPGIALHILQQRRRTETPESFGIDYSTDNLLETARRIAGLDLMISVDSMPAHLAGALAVPTWTLLHAQCDWRWMRGREDSHWYPTMRLFRQNRARDWRPVIARVGDELAQFARLSLAA